MSIIEMERTSTTEFDITVWAESLGLKQKDIIRMLGKKRMPLLWISAQDCTGCKESFLRSSSLEVEELLLNMISLEYSELLSFSSGHEIEKHRETIMDQYDGEYILVIEGSIPAKDEYLSIGGRSVREEILKAAEGAKAVFAFGSCSSWGGIGASKPNPTAAASVTDLIPDKQVVLVPGCPPIAEAMVGTLLHLFIYDELPELDKKGRPKNFYGNTVHQQCHRRPYFDQGLFAESYDDEATKGYCLFKLGCRGPSTFNACESMAWNGGTCSPIGSGTSCIGCSEKNFWDKGPLCYRKVRK